MVWDLILAGRRLLGVLEAAPKAAAWDPRDRPAVEVPQPPAGAPGSPSLCPRSRSPAWAPRGKLVAAPRALT